MTGVVWLREGNALLSISPLDAAASTSRCLETTIVLMIIMNVSLFLVKDTCSIKKHHLILFILLPSPPNSFL